MGKYIIKNQNNIIEAILESANICRRTKIINKFIYK